MIVPKVNVQKCYYFAELTSDINLINLNKNDFTPLIDVLIIISQYLVANLSLYSA